MLLHHLLCHMLSHVICSKIHVMLFIVSHVTSHVICSMLHVMSFIVSHVINHVICSMLHVMYVIHCVMYFSVPSVVDQMNRPMTRISYTEVTIPVAVY